MTENVHLPKLISEHFGVSSSAARRCLAQGGVRLDEELLTVEQMDLPRSELEGKTLKVGKRQEIQL